MDTLNQISSVYVLLPLCTETRGDVFLNLLRSTVAKSKLGDDIDALKEGLNAKSFAISLDDVMDWKGLFTTSKQNRQSKMLGYWAIENFPSLGKRLHGDSWQAPLRRRVEVVDADKSLKPSEIDTLIFKKMRMRIMELNVCSDMLIRLRYFVQVPADICKLNGLYVTSKITSFSIDDKDQKLCWDALKRGTFSTNANENVQQPLDLSDSPFSNEVSGCGMVERSVLPLDLSDSTQTLSVAPCQDVVEQTVSGKNSSRLAKRVRLDSSTDALGDSTTDSFRMALLGMRKDIGNLTKLFDSTATDNCSERLHVIVFKQKDDEIAQMKLSWEESRKEIEILQIEKRNLSEQIKSYAILIIAVQEGIEANRKLIEKYEVDLTEQQIRIRNSTESLADAEKKKDDSMEKIRKLENDVEEAIQREKLISGNNLQLKEQLHELNEELSKWRYCTATAIEANEREKKASDENLQLKEQLHGLTNKMNSMVPVLSSKIEDLGKTVHEMTEKNQKLNEKLQEANEREKMTSDENLQLKEQLHGLTNKMNSMVPVLSSKIEDLGKTVHEMTEKKQKLNEELNKWKDCALTKGNDLEEAYKREKIISEDNVKLKEQLGEMTKKMNSMVPEWNKEIKISSETVQNESSEENNQKETTLEDNLELKELKKSATSFDDMNPEINQTNAAFEGENRNPTEPEIHQGLKNLEAAEGGNTNNDAMNVNIEPEEFIYENDEVEAQKRKKKQVENIVAKKRPKRTLVQKREEASGKIRTANCKC